MGNKLRPMLGFIKYWLDSSGRPFDVTYVDSYLLTMLFELAIATVVLLACYVPLSITSCVLSIRRLKPDKGRGRYGDDDDDDGGDGNESMLRRGVLSIMFVAKSVIFWCACLCICGMIMLLSAFQKIHVIVSGLLMAAFLLLALLHWNRNTHVAVDERNKAPISDDRRSLLVNNTNSKSYSWWEDDFDVHAAPAERTERSVGSQVLGAPRLYIRSIILGIKLHWIRLVLLLPLVALVAVMLPWSTCDLCIAYHPQVISTRFTRQFFADDNAKVCKPETICYSFLTVAEDLTSGIIFNFHIRSRSFKSAHVLFATHGIDEDSQVSNATCIRLRKLEQSRVQCWADLTQLQHNTTYYGMAVMVHSDGTETRAQKALKFRTAPLLSDSSPGEDDSVRFIDSGDLSWSKKGIAIAKHAVKKNPLFAIVAGDIAYENGIAPCYQRYDEWFANWNDIMKTPDGHDIPILTAIGNHEAGNFKQPRSNNYFHLRYFPHHMGLQNETALLERDMYQAHVVGAQTVIISMDTWVHTSPKEQSGWLKSVFETHASKRWKIATYHTAAYPSDLVNYFSIALDIKEAWVPLFDEHGLSVAFEHHYHTYKKSYCLKENKRIDPSSGTSCTYYLGDGSFGLLENHKFEPQPDILEYTDNMAHVWFAELSSHGPAEIYAIGYNATTNTIMSPVAGSEVVLQN